MAALQRRGPRGGTRALGGKRRPNQGRTMRIRIAFGRLLPVLLALAALAVSVVAAGAAAGGGHGNKPQKVKSRDEAAKEKLSPELQTKLESGSTAPVAVLAT